MTPGRCDVCWRRVAGAPDNIAFVGYGNRLVCVPCMPDRFPDDWQAQLPVTWPTGTAEPDDTGPAC